MRAVFGLVLVLGMALAGFAVLMVKGYVADTESALIAERQRTAQVVETVEVLAVKVPKAFGDTLMPEDLTTIRYAKEFLPEGYFATETDLFPEGLAIWQSGNGSLRGEEGSLSALEEPFCHKFHLSPEASPSPHSGGHLPHPAS